MRWDRQRVERDMRLPGVGDGSVVRTFDAPEAMGINFHEVRAKSALNHVPGGNFGFNWTVNQYRGCTHACVFCFARPTHTYLDFDAGRDFEREIVVKVNIPELLRAELAKPTWSRELVALGTNTDPYQWVESRYEMMPEILAALEEARTPVSVLTKSPLALRDIEIYERMAKRVPVSVNFSVPTLDEKAWRATEPHTPSPAARLDAVAEFRRRGIESGVLIAPLMPGINETEEQVASIVERAKAADATFLGGVALHLRGEVRDVFFGWLEAKRPDLLPKYEQLYSGGRAYMPPAQRARVARAVKGWGRTRADRLRPGELQAGRREEIARARQGEGRARSPRARSSQRGGGPDPRPSPRGRARRSGRPDLRATVESRRSSAELAPAGGAVGGPAPEEALATGRGGGSPAGTGPAGRQPAGQTRLF